MRWLDGITDLMDMGLGELQELVMNKECCVTKDKAEASSCPVPPKQRNLFSSVQLLSRVRLFATP